MRRALGWLRARMGVRVVTALAAAVSVAVVLVLAGAALVLLTERLLRDSLEETGTQQATVLIERVKANFEASDLKRNADIATAKRGDLVQVVTGVETDSGQRRVRVLGASDPLEDQPLIAAVMPEPGDTAVVDHTWIRHYDDAERDGEETGPLVREEVMVVAVGAEAFSRKFVVYAALPIESLDEAVDTVLSLVLLGVPILVLIVGGVTYLIAGRALRPVEAIRTQVADVSERDLGRRVPVPPARDEVGRLAETMNAMLARLQDAQGAQRRFVADASHELRSPLATIATGLELLRRDDEDGALVDTLRSETDRVNRLVDALLLLARADERGLQPRREEVDLDEVAQAEQGRPSDGGVFPRVEAEPVRVVGDRGQLARVIRNLVDNARRHARSAVLVTVRRDGGAAVVEVGDDGSGVPPADRARVFERFVRLDEARARADGGAGLGLAIVSEVVAAHGGAVELDDSPLGGALFRVRLPLADADGPAAVTIEGPDGPEQVPVVPGEEPAVEGPSVEEPAVKEPSVEEPAVEEPSVEEPAVKEPSVEEPSVEEPSVEEPSVDGQVREPDTGGPAAGEPRPTAEPVAPDPVAARPERALPGRRRGRVLARPARPAEHG